MTEARKATIALLLAMDEGLIDPKTLAESAVGYMSEDDVRDFIRANDFQDIVAQTGWLDDEPESITDDEEAEDAHP